MVRVACSPSAWRDALFERVLDDAADTGYAGVELHDAAIQAFARQPARLRALLEERTLAAAGAPFAGIYFEREERKDELERLRRLADVLAEVASEGVVAFRTVPHPARRDMVAGEAPLLPLTRDRLDRLADALNQYGDVCRDGGLKAALQNRVGSYVETPDEYEAVLDRTEPDLVWLAPDLGHWAYAGGDPATLIRTYAGRLAEVRLKDFDARVFEHVRAERLGFRAFLQLGGFKEPGEGSLPLEPALAPLARAGFGGWVCVDLEHTARQPKESAAVSRQYLRDRLRW